MKPGSLCPEWKFLPYPVCLFRVSITSSGRKRAPTLSEYVPRTSFKSAATGSLDDGARYRTREMLGTDELQGLEVIGSREVTTTRAGAVGNERDLVETREFWYSEALQTNLKILRIDPLKGRQLVFVTNISLSEPNPELFKVPIGYTVHDLRTHLGRPGFGIR